jgi:hypothetical protein
MQEHAIVWRPKIVLNLGNDFSAINDLCGWDGAQRVNNSEKINNANRFCVGQDILLYSVALLCLMLCIFFIPYVFSSHKYTSRSITYLLNHPTCLITDRWLTGGLI